MNENQRGIFLAEPRAGVLAVERAAGPPLTVPTWYDYEPGERLWIITDDTSLKARLLRKARRFSLCAQNDDPSAYAYVTVEGSCTERPATTEGDIRPLAHRYLGIETGDWYVDNVDYGAAPMRFDLTTERCFAADFRRGSEGS